MVPLHDDHLRAGLGIVDARGHHLVVPVAHTVAGGVGFGFLDVVGIVADDAVPTFAGVRATHGARDPIAGLVVFEAPLLVLVLGQDKNIPPVALIPRRQDQEPAMARIAQAEAFGIAGVQPAPLGPADPFPARPENTHGE